MTKPAWDDEDWDEACAISEDLENIKTRKKEWLGQRNWIAVFNNPMGQLLYKKTFPEHGLVMASVNLAFDMERCYMSSHGPKQ